MEERDDRFLSSTIGGACGGGAADRGTEFGTVRVSEANEGDLVLVGVGATEGALD